MYRVTRVVTATVHAASRVRTVDDVFGIHVDGGPEQWIGYRPEHRNFERNDPVSKTVDEMGRTWATPMSPETVRGDRLWTKTHTILLEQEIQRLRDREDFYGQLSTLDDENKDALDFFRRMRLALITMRRPIEGG